MIALERENVACVSVDVENAVQDLERLMRHDLLAKNFNKLALEKMAVNGTHQLANSICLMADV